MKTATVTKPKIYPVNTIRANVQYVYSMITTDGNPTTKGRTALKRFDYWVLVRPDSLSRSLQDGRMHIGASNTQLHVVSEFPTGKNDIQFHLVFHYLELMF